MGSRIQFDSEYTEPIRDPLWGNIYLSKGLKNLINTPVLQKLSRIRQLGPAYQVYPGATHTRLSHSFGVFFIAKQMIRSLLEFKAAGFLTSEGVRAFLTAALLHDAGHFPYAHSLKELPLKSHEVLTGEIILSQPFTGQIKEWAGADPSIVAAIIDTSLSAENNGEIPFFRKLLSGVLDPDKLDYLNRDAYFCGVPYGSQDVDFLNDQIFPVREKGIGIRETGLPGVENILFSKYLMYKTVYWHKTVRIATAMIKKAVFLGLEEGLISPETLYGIDDEEFSFILSKIRHSCFSLVTSVRERFLYKSVYETPFNGEDPLHRDLCSLKSRGGKEREIAEVLSSEIKKPVPEEWIIIDIPEPISFESEMVISEGGRLVPYMESSSVFTGPAVRIFRETLRKLRLIVHPELSGLKIPYNELLL